MRNMLTLDEKKNYISICWWKCIYLKFCEYICSSLISELPVICCLPRGFFRVTVVWMKYNSHYPVHKLFMGSWVIKDSYIFVLFQGDSTSLWWHLVQGWRGFNQRSLWRRYCRLVHIIQSNHVTDGFRNVIWWWKHIMMSSCGNTLPINGPLWGEIPSQRGSNVEL